MKDNVKFEFGCIMGIPDQKNADLILKLNKLLIPDEMLYHEEGQEYGREVEPHITIKFGLTDTYTEEEMGDVISRIKPFQVNLTKIDVFSNEKFDVVKLNVSGKQLERLNKIFSKLPNEDEYPVYHPHLTIAYVFPGTGKQFVRILKTPIEIMVSKIKYSNPIGKYYYDLN